MGFVERARSAHDRGDVNAAVVTLASGLRRMPDQEDAVDWFLDLYLEEVQNTGLERELLRVLEQRADGFDRYESLVAELEHLERFDKVDALEVALERTGISLRRAKPAQVLVATPAAPTTNTERASPVGERWEEFQSPLDDARSSAAAKPPSDDGPDLPPQRQPDRSEATDVEHVPGAEPGPSSSSHSIPLQAWPEDLPTGDERKSRSPWMWVIIAAVFAALLATALFTLKQAGQSSDEPDLPTTEANR